MDLGFPPLAGSSLLVVDVDKVVNGLAQLFWRSEAGAFESTAAQDGEPAFNLVKPTGARWGEMKMDVLVACQPTVVLRFVGAEIVQNYVNGSGGRTISHHLVNEVQKLAAAAALVVTGSNCPGNNVESGK